MIKCELVCDVNRTPRCESELGNSITASARLFTVAEQMLTSRAIERGWVRDRKTGWVCKRCQ